MLLLRLGLFLVNAALLVVFAMMLWRIYLQHQKQVVAKQAVDKLMDLAEAKEVILPEAVRVSEELGISLDAAILKVVASDYVPGVNPGVHVHTEKERL